MPPTRQPRPVLAWEQTSRRGPLTNCCRQSKRNPASVRGGSLLVKMDGDHNDMLQQSASTPAS